MTPSRSSSSGPRGPSRGLARTARFACTALLALGCASALSACGGGGGGAAPKASAAAAASSPSPTSVAATAPAAARPAPPPAAPAPRAAQAPVRIVPAPHARPAPVQPLKTRPRPEAESPPRLRQIASPRPAPAALQALRFVVRGLPAGESVTLGIGDWRGTLASGPGSFTADRRFPAGSTQDLSIVEQPADFRCSVDSPRLTLSPAGDPPTEVKVNCMPTQVAYSLLTGGAIDVWAVLRNGDLSQQGALTFQADSSSTAMALSPSRRWLYVASATGIQILHVHTDGSLSLDSSMALPAGAQPVAMATDEASRLLFIAYRGLYQVGAYAVNEADGRLQSYGLVSTLTEDATLPPAGQKPKQVSHGRPGALPERLLVSPSGKMLYVADADGRVEAFRVKAARGNPSAVPQGATEPQRQSTALELGREVQPFGKTGAVAMACDADCRDLILVARSSDKVLAMHSDQPDSGWNDWQQRTLHTIHARNGQLRWEPGAVAVNRHTGSLYLAVSSDNTESIFEYSLYDPKPHTDAPVLTSLSRQLLGPYQQADFTRLLVNAAGTVAYAMDPAGSAIWRLRVRQGGPTPTTARSSTTLGELGGPPRTYTTTAAPLAFITG